MRGRQAAVRAGLILGSVCVSVLIAEAAATALRDDAFPLLSIFVADPTLGVRLEPSATTCTRSPLGRITEVSTNALGYRGGEWKVAAERVVPGRILLVGDSQVFGYGVDEADAMASKLAEASPSDCEVLNAAVPSYGPGDYVEVMRQLLPTFRPQHVVFIGNVANDWNEAPVPNRRRTTAFGGFAERRSSRPRSRGPLDGVLSRSHLWFMMRSVYAHHRRPRKMRAHSVLRLIEDAEQLARKRRLDKHLRQARDLCVAHGCQLTAASLPLDVQVSPTEWGKYHASRRPTDNIGRLQADFDRATEALEIPSVDLRDALQHASPGAFLPDDYHLSPQGHEAVAQALSALINNPEGNLAIASEAGDL